MFCTKTCHTKWWSSKSKDLKRIAALQKEEMAKNKKKRVPWEDDGSLEVLMEWLTTHGKCAQCCGANGNKGKSKAQHHKDLTILIETKLPDSSRTEKDVENKIVSLERQFRLASDWASDTGAGVDDPGDFEKAVLARCAHYRELEPIMSERPNAKPLATSEGALELSSDEDDVLSAVPDNEAIIEMNGSTVENKTPVAKAPRTTTNTNDKCLTAVSEGDPKRCKARGEGRDATDEPVSNLLGDPEAIQDPRKREVAARETEASARMLEAQANVAKAQKETSILGTEEKVKLLESRRGLLDDGICAQDELDRILPLP